MKTTTETLDMPLTDALQLHGTVGVKRTVRRRLVSSVATTPRVAKVVVGGKSAKQAVKALRVSTRVSGGAPAKGGTLPEQIQRVAGHPKLRYARRLSRRLEQLYAVAQEEQPEQAPPSLSSLKSLIAFLVQHPELAYPNLVLTPDGMLTAQWRAGRGKLFSLDFTGEEDVRFVIFAPDPRRPYKTTRASGTASLESAMQIAAPYGVLAWAGEPAEEKADQ